MLEGFALAVKVGEEVFGTLGQVHDSLQVDNLCRGLCDIGKRLGEELQVMHVCLFVEMVVGSHIFK